MYDILSLFGVLYPHLSMTTVRQFSRVVLGLLAMTGSVNMLNMSRWTSEGASYRTIQRFFNTVIPWGTLYWVFFSTYLLDPEGFPYILAGDETIVSKSGQSTYGLSRFFSSGHGKTIPSLAFLGLSLVSVKARRSYPMLMEQIVRGDTDSRSSPASEDRDETQPPAPQRTRGRPKGSRNRNKTDVRLSDTLKHLQTMVKALLARVDDLIPLRYLVLDGYFGHNNALQMAKQCQLPLISKLRVNTVSLYFPPTRFPYAGRGRPRIYGQRLNPQQMDAKYRVSTETQGNITTEVYQVSKVRHKKFPDPLNVVCILKTHLLTQHKSHVLLFSSDLALDAKTLIDYYGLRFQIEFNFREVSKQFWGLEDFMNVNKTPMSNAANLSMFMVNVSAKLLAPLRLEHSQWSVLDLKARYRGAKYLHETLKILPQKPEPIVIDQIAEHLGSIGAIHHTPSQLNTS